MHDQEGYAVTIYTVQLLDDTLDGIDAGPVVFYVSRVHECRPQTGGDQRFLQHA